ncbi:MAG: cyclic nucleotide-binding domain-containing protein [Proteobacteria bacterium]|nr:MAG: cyclic nucleotide-binding domain-containing protein [Pseudomonadota bacterium]
MSYEPISPEAFLLSNIKHLKKGEILVKEGETSNSMYWVQSGTLRLYKKKAPGFIELGVVHSGEVVGEMSFLDNAPRSASVEALQPCDIVEIPRGKFEEFINAQPSWMKALVQTLVTRLRSTSNRVKELETSSTVYAKNEEGRTTKQHEFLSTADLLKLSTGLLVAGSRNAELSADGTKRVKAAWFQFYAGQVFTMQLAKVQVFTDVLNEAGVIKIEKIADAVELRLLDLDRLEKFIYFAQEENAKLEEKQLPLTAKGMAILDAVAEFSGIMQAGPGEQSFIANMDDCFAKAAAKKGDKIPFDYGAFEEVEKAGLSKEMRVEGMDKTAVFLPARFQKLYPVLALRQRFRDMNAHKRDG